MMLSQSSFSVGTLPVATRSEPFILLVDDHKPCLVKLKALVESVGYACEIATSASEALVLCDARRPSLVATDLSMPGLDGRGLARWLKARYPSMPILLVTGEGLDEPSLAALRQTFAAVLPKPLGVEKFLTLLDELMPATSRAARPSPAP